MKDFYFIINTVLTAGIGGMVGFGFWNMQRSAAKREKKRQELEEARREKELLTLKGVDTSIKLGEATAIAIKNGKCNGEIDRALNDAKDTRREIDNFYQHQGVRRLH